MDVIESIQKYIENTHMPRKRVRSYKMTLDEIKSLADIADSDRSKAILWAFGYGKAKGYRAAKAEAAHGETG